jgi:alpha-D-xyloside xylohydrolase
LLTGTPALPAPWSLGGLLWRNENKDQAEVLQDAADLRQHDLALSGMWVDRPYDVAVNDFGFKPSQFPDPKAMIAQLHAQGLRLGLWSTPYFDPGYGGKPKSQHHDVATDKGYYVQGANMWAQLMKWGPPIDFTRAEADAFFRSRVQQYTAMGIEGFKLDYGEDIVLGLQQVRIGWQFADGSDERTMHHAYQLGYHAAYADQLPKRQGMAGGGWILARSSTWGDQAKTSMIWPGDLCAGWVRHGECTADGECHAGGLPASVAAAISLPTAGFPLFGADTGGYRHGRAPKELFLRWLQHTALTAVLQIGGGTDHNPWLAQPADNKLTAGAPFDAETLAEARALIRLHARLFPLLWTELSRTQGADPRGVGPLRALGLQYPAHSGDPGLRAHEADQWLLGDGLLVAPVLTPALAREVWLPPGTWVDWSSGEVADGGATGKLVQLQVPLTKLPLWVKAGAIVPLLRPDIDTLAPAQTAGIQSFADDPGLLWARVELAGASAVQTALQLWDGTQLKVQRQDQQLALSAAAAAPASANQVFQKGAVWEVGGLAAAPASVAVAGQALSAAGDAASVATCAAGCWHYAAATQRLTVRGAGWATVQVGL